jgi:hypothetical protein
MILRLCPAPANRLGYSQSAPLPQFAQCSGDHSEIICSLRFLPLIRKDFARRMNRRFEFSWAAASGTV